LSLVAAENQVLAWYAGQLSHFVNWRRSPMSTEPVEYGWWLEKRIRAIEAFDPPTGVEAEGDGLSSAKPITPIGAI
jgi:hypothetical protein